VKWLGRATVFAGATLAACYSAALLMLLAPGSVDGSWRSALSVNLIEFWFWAAMFPVVRRVALAFGPSVRGWPRSLGVHLAVSSALALLESAVQLALRWLVLAPFPAAGAYLTLLRTNFQSDLLIYLVMVLSWSAYDLRRRSRERELVAARLEDELHQASLAALRFQVEPPVLRQVLSRAAELISTDAEKADALLSRIAELLRSVVRTDPTQWISLEEELRLFKTFLAVEDALGAGVVSCHVEPTDSDASLPVPPFLLEMLVRAVSESGRQGTIRLEVSGSEERRTVTVTANAEAAEAGPSARKLEALEDRLVQFYGNPGPLRVARLPSGAVEVEVRLGRPLADSGTEEQPVPIATAHW
jgi:hypothetical protein